MQVDIAESIRETLAEFHPVGLYGLGTLSLNHQPAAFGLHRKSLLPPSMTLHFSESNTSNAHLIDWVASKYDIKRSMADAAVKEFCENMLNAIVNYGKVNLKGVGIFYKSEDKQLKCTPSKQFESLFYKGLPEIKVSHIPQRTLSEKKTPDGLSSDKSQSTLRIDHSVTPDVKIPAKEIKKETSIPAPKETVETPKIVEKAQTQIDNTSVQKIEKSDFNSNITWQPESASTDKPDSIFNLKNLLWLLGLMLLFFIGYWGCNKWVGNSGIVESDDSHEENHLPGVVDSLSNGLIDSSELIENQASLPERCIIVAGAFKKARNVIKMQDRLLKDGYDVYKSVEGDLTRVGFSFDCTGVDLETYLLDFRRKYSRKAWYLDPSLYVEYEE